MNFKIFGLFMFLASVICAVSAGVEIDNISIPGDGIHFPINGQKVKVHYIGKLNDGTVFDSSRNRGTPFTFTIGKGELIKCLDEGIPQMLVGERARLDCSSDYAYGARGNPGIIPPNARLFFDVELFGIE